MKKDINNPEVLKQYARQLVEDEYVVDQFELVSNDEAKALLTITRLTEIKTSFEYVLIPHNEKYVVGLFPFFKKEEVSEVYWNTAVISLHMMFNSARIPLPMKGNGIYQSDDEFVTIGSVSGIVLRQPEIEEHDADVPLMLWGMLLPSYLKNYDLEGICKFVDDNRLMVTHADPHFYQLAPECLAESRVPMN